MKRPSNPLYRLAQLACLLTSICVHASAQSPAQAAVDIGQPAFDLADIHKSPRAQYSYATGGGGVYGGRYTVHQATMVDLISSAYKVEPINVLGGPAWLELDRFDIAARASAGTTPATATLMLRALLADRFKLDVHADIKPQPAYVLSVGKSSKLRESAGTADPGSSGSDCQFQPPPKGATGAETTNIAFACRHTSMDEFVTFLRQVGQPYLARLVVNATSLPGAWDFELRWSFQPPKAGADGISLFDAIDKQLGLKLELKPTPLPVVIVHSVNETPTPNPPGVAAALPPLPPAEFEVATVKPHAPKEKHFGISIVGGQITFQFASIETLIAFSWDIDKEMIARGDYKINEAQDFFDITGKAADHTAKGFVGGLGSGPGITIDDLRAMMRTLMADRFALKVHTEERPYLAYTLFSGTPKMKQADPANRASCKSGPGPDGKDPRRTNPTITRLIYCQNITMAQFAAELRTLAPGNIKTTVLDQTGLTGAYDFTLYWSGENDGTPPPAAASADASTPSEPSAAIPLVDAMSRQLGLKLEKQKRPVEMLVIDHMQEQPTDN